MVRNKIKAGQNYKGLVVKNANYTLLEEGIDYYCLRVRGRPLYVPKWITEISVDDFYTEQDNEV